MHFNLIMKQCYRCKEILELSSFPKNKNGKDGTRNRCKACQNKNMIDTGYRLKNNRKMGVRFTQGSASAKRRHLEWNIAPQEHEELLKQPCFYCLSPLPLTGVGLDRIDSSKGYSLDNVHPCCTICNIMKNALSLSDFYNHIKKIFQTIKD